MDNYNNDSWNNNQNPQQNQNNFRLKNLQISPIHYYKR